MTMMIYIRKTTNSYEDPNTGVTRLLFTEPDAMGRQIEWLMREVKEGYGTPEEWNDSGDEYDVEPSCAEGCQLNSLMTRYLEPFITAYQMYTQDEKGRRVIQRPSMPYPPTKMGRKVSWCATEYDGQLQRFAKKQYERNLAVYNDSIEWMKNHKPEKHVLWHYNDCKPDGGGNTHTVHIIPSMGSLDCKFDGKNLTMGELLAKKQDEEMEKWLAYTKTDAYKKEVEAHQQAEADLRTAMGEGGYTSYSRDDNGRITMWR